MQIGIGAPKRSLAMALMVLLAGLLAGCLTTVPNEATSPLSSPTMTEAEARAIAGQSACAEIGALKETAFFNANTGAWWIDLAADKPGCAPACVVDAAAGTAEVNWRCTGLLPETDIPAPANATPTPEPAEPSNLASLAVVNASSQLRADRLGDYGAASAIDGSVGTPWCEGATGDGAGEWIELTFPGPVEVTAIGVDVGYDRLADDAEHPERLFTDNQRLKQASLIFTDAQQAMVVFEDVRGVQKVSLADAPNGPIVTSTIRLIIDEIYRGERFQDTCIAEIEVWGRTQ